MSHSTFGTKDAMRQNQYVLPKNDPETNRKAAITCAAMVPGEELSMILDMLGLK